MIVVGCYGRHLVRHGVGELIAIVSVVQNDDFDWPLKVFCCPYLSKHDFTKRHSEYRLAIPVELILARAPYTKRIAKHYSTFLERHNSLLKSVSDLIQLSYVHACSRIAFAYVEVEKVDGWHNSREVGSGGSSISSIHNHVVIITFGAVICR